MWGKGQDKECNTEGKVEWVRGSTYRNGDFITFLSKSPNESIQRTDLPLGYEGKFYLLEHQ